MESLHHAFFIKVCFPFDFLFVFLLITSSQCEIAATRIFSQSIVLLINFLIVLFTIKVFIQCFWVTKLIFTALVGFIKVLKQTVQKNMIGVSFLLVQPLELLAKFNGTLVLLSCSPECQWSVIQQDTSYLALQISPLFLSPSGDRGIGLV